MQKIDALINAMEEARAAGGYSESYQSANLRFNPDVVDTQHRPVLGNDNVGVRSAGFGMDHWKDEISGEDKYGFRGWSGFKLKLGDSEGWYEGGAIDDRPGFSIYPGLGPRHLRAYGNIDQRIGGGIFTTSYQHDRHLLLEQNNAMLGFTTTPGRHDPWMPGDFHLDLRLFTFKTPKQPDTTVLNANTGEWTDASGREAETMMRYAGGGRMYYRLDNRFFGEVVAYGEQAKPYEDVGPHFAGLRLQFKAPWHFAYLHGKERALFEEVALNSNSMQFLELQRWYEQLYFKMPITASWSMDLSGFYRHPEKTQKEVTVQTNGMPGALPQEVRDQYRDSAAAQAGVQQTQAAPAAGTLEAPKLPGATTIANLPPSEEGDTLRLKIGFGDSVGRGGGAGFQWDEKTYVRDPMGNIIMYQDPTQVDATAAGTRKPVTVPRYQLTLSALGPYELASQAPSPEQQIQGMSEVIQDLRAEVSNQERTGKITAEKAQEYKTRLDQFSAELATLSPNQEAATDFLRNRLYTLRREIKGEPVDSFLEGATFGYQKVDNWNYFYMPVGFTFSKKARLLLRLDYGQGNKFGGGAETVVNIRPAYDQIKFNTFVTWMDPTRMRVNSGLSYLNDGVLSVPSMGLYYVYDKGLYADFMEGTFRITENLPNFSFLYGEFVLGKQDTYRGNAEDGTPLQNFMSGDNIRKRGWEGAVQDAMDARVLAYSDWWWKTRFGFRYLVNPATYYNNMEFSLTGELKQLNRTWHFTQTEKDTQVTTPYGNQLQPASHTEQQFGWSVMFWWKIYGNYF